HRHPVTTYGMRHEGGVLPVGRSKEPGTHAQVSAERPLRALELRVAGIEPADLVVEVRVVPEEVTAVERGARDVGPGVERLADREERALDAVLVEDGAHGRRVRD